MADSQDAIELKRRARRRLVGAIALVVFVVIALPIVLDREPKPVSQDLTIQIPSQDAGKFSSRVLPAEPASAPADARAAGEASKMDTPKVDAPKTELKPGDAKVADSKVADSKAELKPAAPAAKTEVSAPKVATAPAPQAEPETKAPAAANPAPGVASASPKDAGKSAATESKAGASSESFIVPLGVFSKADNIKQVRSKAGAAGFKTFTEGVAGTDRVRVRAGPFSSRDAAEKARDKLKGAGLDVGAVSPK